MTFNLAHFRAEFASKMATIAARIQELDLVAAELHQRVTGFSGRAL